MSTTSMISSGDTIEHLNPFLSYTLSSPHPSVSSLINSSMREIIPTPAPPIVDTISPTVTSSTGLVYDQAFIVKERLVACQERNASRLLLTNELCCCLPIIQSSKQLTRWEDNSSNEISICSHFIHSQPKVEPTASKYGLPQSLSTSKIEGRLFRGYPYEKIDIPFHFQHLNCEHSDVVSGYADLYRKAHTYPNMEKLKSSSTSDYTSYSAPSVIEPKLLIFGVSTPGVAELHTTSNSIRSSYKFDTVRHGKHQASDKRRKLSRPTCIHHSLNNTATYSASILEVFHGHSPSKNNLPHPASPDFPSSIQQTPTHSKTGLKIQTSSRPLQFKDVINMEETMSHKSQKKPNVRWASHSIPTNIMLSGLSREKRCSTDSSQQKRQSVVSTLLAQTAREGSFPRTRQVHLSGDIILSASGSHDLSATSFSRITPNANVSSSNMQHMYSNSKESKAQVPTTSVSHRNSIRARSDQLKKETSSLSLMPTSIALVPSLGIYSRTALAQRAMDNL